MRPMMLGWAIASSAVLCAPGSGAAQSGSAAAMTLLATIPIFPLQDVVLFPNSSAPLHIFEPRYRAMVADALEGDSIIGMVLLQPGYEAEYEGRPPVYAVGLRRSHHCVPGTARWAVQHRPGRNSEVSCPERGCESSLPARGGGGAPGGGRGGRPPRYSPRDAGNSSEPSSPSRPKCHCRPRICPTRRSLTVSPNVSPWSPPTDRSCSKPTVRSSVRSGSSGVSAGTTHVLI